MSKFNIRIREDNGELYIYNNPDNIIVNDETIKVDYEDKSIDHNPEFIDEIIIKPNR